MTNKINGIDVSEYFIDVVDEGGSTIDYKILPNSERLLVEKIFEQNQQLARLQEENKRLQMLSCANCGEKYLSPDGAELYEKNVQLQKENEGLKSLNDFNVQKIEVLQEENERLNQELDIKEKMLDKFMIGSGETLEKLQKENEKLKADLKGETEQCQKWYQLETDKHFQMLKYEQALEEIRKEANRLLFVENPIYGYNNSNYFEILAKYVLAKTDEVLNDRD